MFLYKVWGGRGKNKHINYKFLLSGDVWVCSDYEWVGDLPIPRQKPQLSGALSQSLLISVQWERVRPGAGTWSWSRWPIFPRSERLQIPTLQAGREKSSPGVVGGEWEPPPTSPPSSTPTSTSSSTPTSTSSSRVLTRPSPPTSYCSYQAIASLSVQQPSRLSRVFSRTQSTWNNPVTQILNSVYHYIWLLSLMSNLSFLWS